MPPFIQWVCFLFGAWLIYLTVTSLLEKKRSYAQAQVAQGWQTTMGRVLSLTIHEGRSIDSKTRQEIHTYRPEVEFEYQVGAQTFKLSRLAFGKVMYYSKAESDAFARGYAQNAAVLVCYDAAVPKDAVLDRDPRHAIRLVVADFFFLLVGVVLIGVGVWGMVSP